MDLYGRKRREAAFHDSIAEDGPRDAAVGKYYSITGSSRERYRKAVVDRCRGMTVLEYGCGLGGYAFEMADAGADVTGIDISEVSVRIASDKARELGLSGRLRFMVMDAEELSFPDSAFDIVCGMGILHHLDLSSAYREVARVLKPGGRAVFIEPMGHNPVINWFRDRTPGLRTADEHPLKGKDIDQARKYFGGIDTRYCHMLSLGMVPFRNMTGFGRALGIVDAIDGILLSLPGIRMMAWQVILVLSQPDKDGGPGRI